MRLFYLFYIVRNLYYCNSKKKTIPYCYLIIHKDSGMKYYGARFCKGANPKLFFIDYFTSSKAIMEIIKTEGIKAFEFQIRKTFHSPKECIKWEQKVLKRLKIKDRPDFFNEDDAQQPHLSIQFKTKTICITNVITKVCIRWPKSKIIPPGYIRGNINLKKSTKYQTRKWWYYPITNKTVHTKVCPKGYLSGRGLNYKSNSEKMKLKNLRWITNGEESKHISKRNKIPLNWYIGRTFSKEMKKNMGSKKGFKWINNMSKNATLKKGKNLPKGWVYGKLVDKLKQRMFTKEDGEKGRAKAMEVRMQVAKTQIDELLNIIQKYIPLSVANKLLHDIAKSEAYKRNKSFKGTTDRLCNAIKTN